MRMERPILTAGRSPDETSRSILRTDKPRLFAASCRVKSSFAAVVVAEVSSDSLRFVDGFVLGMGPSFRSLRFPASHDSRLV